MAIERARTHVVQKPWGAADLRPWSTAERDGQLVGEIWYERPGTVASEPSLLLKLLFTNQPLSIQVHPDDAFAQSLGLARGKTEAWYILGAAPGAKVALGLKESVTQRHLRAAIDDGSIVGLIAWRPVQSGEVIFVPATTIHAIGPGLVIAEIQQRSDATFRMFDFGRKRALHAANAVAVAAAGPAEVGLKPKRLSDERMLLASNSHFAFERIELAPGSTALLEAERETWLLVIGGSARTGKLNVAIGDAVFATADTIDIHAGSKGVTALVAYAGAGPVPHLLRPARPSATGAALAVDVQAPTPIPRSELTPNFGHAGAPQ